MKSKLHYSSLAAAALVLCAASALAATKAWVETIELPTYKVAPPDPSPRFYAGRTYQGAKATFYPYPVWDQMTETREVMKYKALNLENEYVELSILPELGGRIFTARDKGNGYDFFYRQNVIKPALIGMLGAWISGGVEWNVPHHHRASSFMPVDHAIVDEPDGGKTIWVGETELRHRLRWLVGTTLRPGKSYVEMTVKIFNRTPAAQSFLFWINPAVHANANYQVIFPPSLQWTVQHGKPEFAQWPIARQVYGGVDYTRGVDISWWKNHPSPVSFFAWDCREDFFGGYDHGKQAGVVQVSNHHVSPGKKFFEWGNGPEGEMWTKILSDEDGPYLELMAGSYSDNQPDYSWCQPHEVKVFKHYWYPVRELGGLKNANTDAAVNLEFEENTAKVAVNTTEAKKGARVVLASGAQALAENKVDISPNKPFARQFTVPNGVRPQDVKLTVYDAAGKEIIAYQEAKLEDAPKPKPVSRPRPPKEIQSNEELLLTGLRVEQLYSPSFDPVPYYQEALRRDAGDYRANVALGSLFCRQGRFAEAIPLLERAVGRATENYIRPKDCEGLYYLGVARRAQGELKAARDLFYRAIWDRAWQAPGYYALAELSAMEGNYPESLRLVEQAIQSGALDVKAIELKASLLRVSGESKAARDLCDKILGLDPLNGRAQVELVLASKGSDSKLAKVLGQSLRGEWTSYLEIAVDYANAGFYGDALRVLDALPDKSAPPGGVALAAYYSAYYAHKAGKPEDSAKALKAAADMPTDFGFPFQYEAEPVLLHAIQVQPGDANARYLLGNLLYDNQPARAIKLWEEAVELKPSHAMAQRNLALALAHSQNKINDAVTGLEKAVTLTPDNPRMYYELDVLYQAAGAPVERRLKSLERNLAITALRDDAATRRIELLIAAGRTGEALRVLAERQFHNWEGSSSLHDVYVDACLQDGMAKLRAGQTAEASSSFASALEYPANQQVGKPKHERRVSEIAYWQARAAQALGKASEAKVAFEKAARGGQSRSASDFYRALALRKLGKTEEANALLTDLHKHALAQTSQEREEVDYFAKFGEKRASRLIQAEAHYLAAIAAKGLGHADEAVSHFAKALELDPGHVWARTMQSETKFE